MKTFLLVLTTLFVTGTLALNTTTSTPSLPINREIKPPVVDRSVLRHQQRFRGLDRKERLLLKNARTTVRSSGLVESLVKKFDQNAVLRRGFGQHESREEGGGALGTAQQRSEFNRDWAKTGDKVKVLIFSLSSNQANEEALSVMTPENYRATKAALAAFAKLSQQEKDKYMEEAYQEMLKSP